MTIVRFDVPGEPAPQSRPRARKAGKHARLYRPKKDAKGRLLADVVYTEAIQAVAGQYKREIHELDDGALGPLVIHCLFLFKRPKRLIWKRKRMPRCQHKGKPDIDNLLKCVYDALAKKAVEADDTVFQGGFNAKAYASGSESAHTKILIRKAGDDWINSVNVFWLQTNRED